MVANLEKEKVQKILYQVSDPEIPVLSIMDMGIVRDLQEKEGIWDICITPTYSGCPAMDVIQEEIEQALIAEGYQVKVRTVLSPPWTTDWITEEGRRKLKEYGIAPPLVASQDKKALMGESRLLTCTNCGSNNTQMISQFGSTPCKALFRCNDCLEPFDYFKCF